MHEVIINVLIKLKYIGWEENGTEIRGYFPVNSRQFEENSDWVVAEIAYQWVREILREEHISKLVQVTYNGEHDITAFVRQKFNSWSDDLPFSSLTRAVFSVS